MKLPGMEKYAKKPAPVNTPNFAGPTGYGKVTTSFKSPTVPSLTSTPAKVKPLATTTPATGKAEPVSIGGQKINPGDPLYDKIMQNATEKKAAVAETVQQVKHMLESVTTRDDIDKIKKYIDRQFTKHGLISELAFAQRNHLIERVVYIGAQRRREHARMS